MRLSTFRPRPSLLTGETLPQCKACVIVPVRNERLTLAATLSAFVEQVDCAGQPLDLKCFEVLLLLNNCTDQSMQVAKSWKACHPQLNLHIVKRSIPATRAHVGTARRWLMDTAWHRLNKKRSSPNAILSTDADTIVAPDWIAKNLKAIACGAQAVGGVISWKPGELDKLPNGLRRAVLADRQYQRLQAELEHLLDPQAGDPWPRHTEHFGASLACTPQAYARAGGLPAVPHLEDVAFVSTLERSGVTIRHDPEVVVHTSGRRKGRCAVGLSGQLRRWQNMCRSGKEHVVPSASWLAYRFAMLRKLRQFHARKNRIRVEAFPACWHQALKDARQKYRKEAHFLEAIQCEKLMWEAFAGKRTQTVKRANISLRLTIRDVKASLAC